MSKNANELKPHAPGRVGLEVSKLAMSTFVSPQIFLVSLLAGWLNQEQQQLLEYLQACQGQV